MSPLAAKAGVIAVSVAVAAAIAVYESPELRRMADDLRRKIAIALHSLGDNIQPGHRPNQQDPIFNRPEDAEGFMQSRAEPGVDADEETKRRQREELMYWNSLRLQKKDQEDATSQKGPQEHQQTPPPVPPKSTYGSTFDDFLHRDRSSPQGTYVFNTGADPRQDDEGLLRRRGPEGVSGLRSWAPANPFADENGIELDEQHPVMLPNIISPGRDEMSDIYSATATEPASPVQKPAAADAPCSATVFPASADHNISAVLFDAAAHLDLQARQQPASEDSHTIERELGADEYMTAGQEDTDRDAYASIQAWAQDSQNSDPGFYSPLPASPSAPMSEPELVSEGALTPTDSVSVISSSEDLGNATASAANGQDATVYYDVVSDDEEEDGIATPVSWSEVGSVISESDAGQVRA
ncbi:hypothetical protein MAPG_00881 [Magnaporthiopsis poae ATCC 64411]|uniref:Uncharacterized protein n=1 Tax=Magnaporthiopsis poae (strain ATCC 64411 / 73-15) TaxID=644358 RepID=A0A0C4DM78_MAGP6|nr:hypothetical protein MAPG_00881 [Magnaporthiopsis poae ATCC 64411]